MALIVVYGTLNLGPGESREHEDHPQPRLHWRLSQRLGEVHNTPEPSNAGELRDRNQLGVKEHIGSNDSFGQCVSAREVDHRPDCRRGGETAPDHDLLGGKTGAADRCARTPAAANWLWDGHFDRMAELCVQSVKPKGGAAGESRAGGQALSDRSQDQFCALF
jgi:hypothetical protein